MERLRALLRQAEFRSLLFFVSALLFVRPVLLMARDASAESVLLALYVPWAVVIAVLYLVAQSVDAGGAERQPEGEVAEAGGESDV